MSEPNSSDQQGIKNKYPSEEEWDRSIKHFFVTICTRLEESALDAFLSIERGVQYSQNGDVYKVINYVPEDEMSQLCMTLNELKRAMDGAEDRSSKAIYKLFAYTHIMEADRPYQILYNLLRLYLGKPAIPTFLPFNNEADGSVIDNTEQRIKHLHKIADPLGLDLFSLMKRLYVPHLRNSFLHAQYVIFDGSFMGTRDITPLRKKGERVYLQREDLDQLHESISSYLLTFLRFTKTFMEYFQTGKVFDTQAGKVKFDKGRWLFADEEIDHDTT